MFQSLIAFVEVMLAFEERKGRAACWEAIAVVGVDAGKLLLQD